MDHAPEAEDQGSASPSVLEPRESWIRGDLPLRSVLCGSYRRDPEGLKLAFEALVEAGCEVLSPSGTDFPSEIDGFVFGVDESELSPIEIEVRHLDALRKADFVWLHAPDGYVGNSASLEIGYAHALGVPVYCAAALHDVTLAALVRKIESPSLVPGLHAAGENDPGRPLRALQDYYGVMAARRGYAHETPQDTMLLLTEEIGELARAVRRRVGLARDGEYPEDTVGDELADVQLYIVHFANVLGIDLSQAVTRKERVNAARHSARVLSRTA